MQSSHQVVRSRAIRGASLCYFWLIIGFTLGTLVLLWPVRWITAAVQQAGGSQGLENALVIILVLAYVGVSFVLALRMNTLVCSRLSGRSRWTVVALATLVTATTAWSWRNPGRMLAGIAGGGDIAAVKTQGGAIFEFGAYPDEEMLRSLKKRGITTVISLQHPSVVVERDGIAEEKTATKRIGLALLQAPMLPWFSENSEALDKIRKLAVSGHGRFYVHCGLGRDRVNIVKRLIESVGGKTATVADLRPALGFEGRKADFIHGSLVSLAPQVWLVPYPEKEELYGCFFEGRPGHVVLLLDSTDARQDTLLKESRRQFATYGVPFTELPLRASTSRQADSIARVVRGMTPPLTVVAYRTPWHDGKPRKDTEAAVAFRDAFGPAWKITTGTVAVGDSLAFTGGREQGC